MKFFTLIFVTIQLILISCSGNTKNETISNNTVSEKNESSKDVVQKIAVKKIDTANIPAYTVAEFIDLYKRNPKLWEDKTIILEGVFHGSLGTGFIDDTTFFYNYSLYNDKKKPNGNNIDPIFLHDKKKAHKSNIDHVYFETKIGEPKPEDKGGKVKVKGKISGTVYGDNPKMIDGQVLENNEEESVTLHLKDAKTYSVAEFVNSYKKDKEALTGKIVIIEGYFLNPTINTTNGKEVYNFSLFENEDYGNESLQVFFVMKEGKPCPKGYRVRAKMIGEVSGEEFFEKPKIIRAEVVE